MERLSRTTPDLTQENIDKIAELFPDVITESQDADGNVVRAVDFDALRDDLSGEAVEGRRERYQFTWPGKAEAKLEARRPCSKTLRPCPEKSVDWDTTQNVYIEGDNLEALKIMRETYAGKVKLIYIDPPYNTGHDFVYDDDFSKSQKDYEARSGDYDGEGGRLVANPESNGRFHSDWCSMMYPRLILARDLLTDDGAIVVCIDDNEYANMQKLCDEIFGFSNRIATIIWQHSIQPKGYLSGFSVHHNYLLFYRKSESFVFQPLARTAEDNKAYSNPDNDPKGPWRSGDVRNALYRPNLIYDVVTPSGKIIKPCQNGWRWSQETMKEKMATGEIVFSPDETRIIRKIYLSSLEGRAPETIWFAKDVGSTREAVSEIKDLFNKTVFDTPKPTNLITRFLNIVGGNDYTVLDFFSGSSTTAHAVLKQNAEDGSRRKFIMVQLPEICDEKSEAYKAGYHTICEIGEERIRRAGRKITEKVTEENRQPKIGEEPKPLPDVGFRVFRVDSSNFEDTSLEPASTDQASLDSLVDNLKPDRTPMDLLFQVLPKFRIPYSAEVEELDVEGHKVYDVNGGQLLACFDRDVDGAAIEAIAKMRPIYAVFRDASLSDDPAAANLEELFKTYSPDTIRRVI